MIVSMFHVQVPAPAIEPFEKSWSQRAGLVDSMPGFRGLEVLRDGETPGAYIVLTHWDSRQDFERWASSPAFQAGHAQSSGSAQGTQIRFFEVLGS